MTASAIKGLSVHLRRSREEDLSILTAIRNDAGLQAQVLARARGSSIAQVREWLAAREASGSVRFFIVAAQGDDQAIGYLQFIGLDPIDRRAELGICLAPTAQGLGYGSEAIALGLAHLQASDGLQKCTLQVRADNERAVRCYRRLGFATCGILRRHTCLEGAWRDIVLMEWLAEQAPPCAP